MLELIMVLIIIGILAIVSVPMFRKAFDESRDKEARSILFLIEQFEETYRLESGGLYKSCPNNPSCNNGLNLTLPVDADREWDYSVDTNPAKDEFCAEAENTNDGRTFRFYPAGGDTEPVSGTCPAL
jgi:type II secretory pathway pseudopilin PulG